MTDLASKTCVSCKGATALKGEALAGLAAQLPEWTVVEEHHLTRTFKFLNFMGALAFVNRVGAVAEEQGHHPNISFTWGRAEFTIYTHDAGGLTENDFILAAKIDELAKSG
jgi:4a-hydroxytetrahydrobiopterin dehydratase